MDCVRVSTGEIQNEKYHANYTETRAAQGSGKNACRQACVSSRLCKVWQYTPEQKCLMADATLGPYPRVQKALTGTYSGLIECENTYSMLKLIWWIMILGLVLVVVWYVLNVAKPRSYSKGEYLFPRFFLSGPKTNSSS